jgi:hypothetical protein
MDYTISREKLIRLIDKLIKEKYCDFSMGKCHIENMKNVDDPIIHYYIGKNIFAKYHLWSNTLFLKKDLFYTLEDYFGSDAMSFVLDWFNDEFIQEATTLDYI